MKTKYVYFFLTLLLLTACSKTQPVGVSTEQSVAQELASAQSASVSIKDFKFSPAEIRVSKA